MTETVESGKGGRRVGCPEEAAFLDLLRTTDMLSLGLVRVLKSEDLSPTQYNVPNPARRTGRTPLWGNRQPNEHPHRISTDRAPQAFRPVEPDNYAGPPFGAQTSPPPPGGPCPGYGCAPPPPPPPYYYYGPAYPYYWGPGFAFYYGPRFSYGPRYYYRRGFYGHWR